MKRDFLKTLGLDDEIIEQIMSEAGKDTTSYKTQIANLTEELNVKDGVINTKNSKIKELEAIDVESLKASEYQRGMADGTKEVETFKFNTALESQLKDLKVRDSKAIMGYLDREKLSYADGKIAGLEEQINPLKESHDYLFQADEKAPKFSDSTPGVDKPATGLSELMSVMGIKE